MFYSYPSYLITRTPQFFGVCGRVSCLKYKLPNLTPSYPIFEKGRVTWVSSKNTSYPLQTPVGVGLGKKVRRKRFFLQKFKTFADKSGKRAVHKIAILRIFRLTL